ncbi:DUF4007 family protein [Alteromonas sp. KUL49]|uniref:DUF4007 family protein n=1 Tax=Alteromonas sp. KUL49 TaxID=2480798 RepID=UPI00102EDD2A|nr:DUF4007 family protein [Alteromonas sp. KUL49]TAP34140.1 DUF4007 family protein [Alteromonas sp. KUL49]GEA13626.1 hypothetical protein KUL49_40010 [Alteromonas sp. KUL49]
MKLIANKTAFGRHETFFCRLGWLTKGFWKANEFSQNSDLDFFRQEEAVVSLGAGKNMVSSIKYWLQATKLFESTKEGLKPTELGTCLMGTEKEEGWDAYLEDKNTLWLIHWLVASNAELATTPFWFFNFYHKSNFTQEELKTAISDFAKENIDTKISTATLKNDVSVLTRMYAKSQLDKKTAIEDTLDSPLVELNLIQSKLNKEFSSQIKHRDISPYIIGFALCELFNFKSATSLSVEELVYSRELSVAIGAVFRLPENSALAHIERAIDSIPGNFEIRETAGVHQVYKVNELNSLDYLRAYYEGDK